MKVALIGSHGVGKTTLCFELAARLKRRGVDLDVVREVARRCPLPINQETTVAAQEWILHTQIVWEIEAASSHEVVICDRSVLDNYCYLAHVAGRAAVWERVLDHWLGTYDLLVHVPLWRRPAYDGVRAVDPSFQEEIERLLATMLEERRLASLRLAPEQRGSWGRDIVERLAPLIAPTLPLFPADELDVDLDR
jgi:nicotinamide riboside kinase